MDADENTKYTTRKGDTFIFDEALVLWVLSPCLAREVIITSFRNGLHPTINKEDPSPAPHATMQMTDLALRKEKKWFVLHWRP